MSFGAGGGRRRHVPLAAARALLPTLPPLTGGKGSQLIGVVLAGGASRRMGRDKATVELAGKPLIAWVVGAIEGAGFEAVIAGRDWDGRHRIDDHPDFGGPLAGLAAALAIGDDVLLVAVDQPWLRVETLVGLSKCSGTAVPIDRAIAQVTCARYRRDHPLTGDGSLQSLVGDADLVDQSRWATWGEDGRSWFSVDTPADLKAGLQLFGVPQPPI